MQDFGETTNVSEKIQTSRRGISDHRIKRGLELAAGCMLYGKPILELTREEAIAELAITSSELHELMARRGRS